MFLSDSPFYDKIVRMAIDSRKVAEIQKIEDIIPVPIVYGNATFNKVQICSSPFIPGNKFVTLINDKGLIKDIDNNGLNDIAFITADSNNNGYGVVRIAYQTSLGNFNCVPVGSQSRYLPYGLTLGDFNNDGKIDIANVSALSRTLNILINNGNGNFSDYTITNSRIFFPNHISAYGSDIYFTDENYSLFKYNYASNTLVRIDSLVNLDYACDEGLSLADLNNDGRLDFVCSRGNYIRQGSVYYRLNLGNGWSNKYSLTINYYYHGVAVGDLNNDNRPDIVSCTSFGNDTALISIRINQGGNPLNFQSVNVLLPNVRFGTCELKIADIDCDGDNDIVWASGLKYDSTRYTDVPVPKNGLGWLENLGNNNWLVRIIESNNGPYGIYGLDVGYVNSDKKPDIVAGIYNGLSAKLYVYYNTTNVSDNSCKPITPVEVYESDNFNYEILNKTIKFNKIVDYSIYKIDGSLIGKGSSDFVRINQNGVYFLKIKNKVIKVLID
jgi:hypothetical protein